MLRLASDLHLEFYTEKVIEEGQDFIKNLVPRIFTPSENDKDTVLILAGDIILIKELKHFTYFFELVGEQFKSVIWVFGNHEWFKSTLTKRKLDDVLQNLKHVTNLHILNNSVYEDENYYFIGSTLWSDIKKGDYLTAQDVAKVSFDYKKITFQEGQSYSKLRPRHVSKMFIENEAYIFNELKNSKSIDKIKVVVTHHPPTIEAIPDFLKDNPDFWSDFGNVNFQKLKDNDILPKYWLHGHIHTNQHFNVMGVEIISNTRGYDDFNSKGKSLLNQKFSPEFKI